MSAPINVTEGLCILCYRETGDTTTIRTVYFNGDTWACAAHLDPSSPEISVQED